MATVKVLWSGWKNLGGDLASAPAVVHTGSERLEVFVRGQGGDDLVQRSFDGNSWSGWKNLGGDLASAPAVVHTGSGRLEVFVRGQGGDDLVQRSFDGIDWSGWENLGGDLASAPSPVHLGKNRLRVFVHGLNDDELVTRYYPTIENPRVFGAEVNQGLPEYDLIAGKDTLVRVFVGSHPPKKIATDSIGTTRTASATIVSDLVALDEPAGVDRASLRVRGPNNLEFEVQGQMSTDTFTNSDQRYSEADNVNFYIPGSQLPSTGDYSFRATLYRGAEDIGFLDLGRRTFHPTKDLRILIAVSTTTVPQAGWTVVMNSLSQLQRNFPIRAGIGPIDGDLSLGLRFAIDPVPFDTDWPDWEPVIAKLEAFNANQEALGRPDRADRVLLIRFRQPGETESGGVTQPAKKISSAWLLMDATSRGSFDTLITHELGHSFGGDHTEVREIGSPSAFDVSNRVAIAPVSSTMFNPYEQTLDTLFTPGDWKKIREELVDPE